MALDWNALAPVLANLAGAYYGSNQMQGAIGDASSAAQAGHAQSIAAYQDALDKTLAFNQPYQQAGANILPDLTAAAKNTGAGQQYINQLQGLKAPNLPSLSLPNLPTAPQLPQFNYQFNEADPGYQFRQQQLQKSIDQAAAARGNYNSRAAINAQAEGNMALTADEIDRQFGRQKDIYNLGLAGANTQWGMGKDTYNMGYQNAMSQYGADYQKGMDLYNTDFNKISNLFNMSNTQANNDFSRLYDVVNIGQRAAGSASQAMMATGQNMANSYSQLANALGLGALATGQSKQDFASGLGGLIGDYNIWKEFGGGGEGGGLFSDIWGGVKNWWNGGSSGYEPDYAQDFSGGDPSGGGSGGGGVAGGAGTAAAAAAKLYGGGAGAAGGGTAAGATGGAGAGAGAGTGAGAAGTAAAAAFPVFMWAVEQGLVGDALGIGGHSYYYPQEFMNKYVNPYRVQEDPGEGRANANQYYNFGGKTQVGGPSPLTVLQNPDWFGTTIDQVIQDFDTWGNIWGKGDDQLVRPTNYYLPM
jgi:hypothetical protein